MHHCALVGVCAHCLYSPAMREFWGWSLVGVAVIVSAYVLSWRISGAEFLAQTDGTVRATFNAVNCSRQSAGSFTATASGG